MLAQLYCFFFFLTSRVVHYRLNYYCFEKYTTGLPPLALITVLRLLNGLLEENEEVRRFEIDCTSDVQTTLYFVMCENDIEEKIVAMLEVCI